MAEKKNFLIGSRGSRLSLAYSGYVKDLLLKTNSQFNSNSIKYWDESIKSYHQRW